MIGNAAKNWPSNKVTRLTSVADTNPVISSPIVDQIDTKVRDELL
jgi:hypothetical protein